LQITSEGQEVREGGRDRLRERERERETLVPRKGWSCHQLEQGKPKEKAKEVTSGDQIWR
jgi:hypothetical protein